MTNTPGSYSIDFPEWYDDLAAFEHEAKGYLSGVVVRFTDGKRYALSVMDPSRLQQDLEETLRMGGKCLAEPNLIVVPAVTRGGIGEAVAELVREDFFHRLGSSG